MMSHLDRQLVELGFGKTKFSKSWPSTWFQWFDQISVVITTGYMRWPPIGQFAKPYKKVGFRANKSQSWKSPVETAKMAGKLILVGFLLALLIYVVQSQATSEAWLSDEPNCYAMNYFSCLFENRCRYEVRQCGSCVRKNTFSRPPLWIRRRWLIIEERPLIFGLSKNC